MMEAMDIAFPNLGIYLHNMPRGFSIFGFEITLYGVLIGIGMLAGILLVALVITVLNRAVSSLEKRLVRWC